jgi:hypothetical protein
MQDIRTFLDAGWDFVDEVYNGTSDYWQMAPGGYPTLRYDRVHRPRMPEGLGTAEQPYLIRDARDLGTAWFEPLAYYRLVQSVDLSGIAWSMAVIPWFGGHFDGNGYGIRNLHIQGGGYLGLFGTLGPTASVSNLGVEAAVVYGTGRYVAALAGSNPSGHIMASHSNGSVSGTEEVGGLVGSNSGSIMASHSVGLVSGTYCVGGLVGANGGGTITTSYSTGAVSGGGLVGGLVGRNMGDIAASYSAGAVSGTDKGVGGLVGRNWIGTITTSYSTGAVRGKDNVGGLVGWNEISVWAGGHVTNCYSTGAVSGSSNVGGLVGYNTDGRGGKGKVTACSWDRQTSGQTTSAGGTGKTTAEMQTATTFLEADWDFVGETANGTEDIWWIDEGKDYPRLWWELDN